ncbi:inactive serine/threonine-protein kinase VRK3 [Protopterus annectens]|uniref:inactive serine/threonine-protein kinase VRK3 n=1 Tax=Protopterus annectens TaxID=7888 RepID=UPI001CFAF24A|nr:inactive serine/threonine-protein kinase VRK3 [Protopterus annectens]
MQKVEETITSDSSKVAASAELVKKDKPNLRKKGSPQKKDLPDSSPCVEPSSPKRKVEENVACDTSRIAALGKSPQGKRARRSAVEPLPENEILTDINAKSWQLLKLVANDENGVLYEARGTSGATAKEQYLLKLDTKEGRIFNEQNFFLRAVKPKTVQMWQKSHGVNFLGIPPCIGFGLHAEKYRFLVFPDYGNSLQSFLDASKKLLSEKAVFQITYRLISVLEYIHDNEYVHGDIKAENLFATTTDLTKIYLTGYGHAFRYYPSGKHVEYREGSRTLHEGTVEFTSLDSHKGVGPSCRSDLESLGYCMVKWLTGSLPWSSMLEKPKDVTALKQKCKEDPTSFLKQCFGKKKIPDALITYFQHVASLRYEEKPNYEQLKTTLQNALKKLKTTVDDPVDL